MFAWHLLFISNTLIGFCSMSWGFNHIHLLSAHREETNLEKTDVERSCFGGSPDHGKRTSRPAICAVLTCSLQAADLRMANQLLDSALVPERWGVAAV